MAAGYAEQQTSVRIFSRPSFWIVIGVVLLLSYWYQLWPWRTVEGYPVLSLASDWAIVEFRYRIVGSLLIIPILYASLFFQLPLAFLVLTLAVGAVSPVVFVGGVSAGAIFNLIILLAPFLAVTAARLQINWRAREKRLSLERENERRAYIQRILDAQESERARIAYELHDDTVQTLLAIANRAEGIARDPEGSSGHASWIRDTTIQASENLRRITSALRPAALDLGLIPALRWLVITQREDSGLPITLDVIGKSRRLPAPVEIAIFRIVQEAVNNVRKHSRASQASVTIDFGTRALSVRIEDNGIGFNLPKTLERFAVTGKLGLVGIKERMRLLNGQCRIITRHGRGTLISARLGYPMEDTGYNSGL